MALDIRIIYNCPGYLICIKPQGIVSEDPGLPSLICAQERIPALFPVHRLDQGTGGLIVLAKNPDSCKVLSEAFSAHKTEKNYLAVIQASKIEKSGTFEDYLYHDRKTNKSYIVKTMRKGARKSACSWSLLETVRTEEIPLHLVRVDLQTGRTHQIRVQFASRGMPIFGDKRYGSCFKSKYPALWSAGLSFPDPEDSGKKIRFDAPPPDMDPWNRFSPAAREEAFHELPQQCSVLFQE